MSKPRCKAQRDHVPFQDRQTGQFAGFGFEDRVIRRPPVLLDISGAPVQLCPAGLQAFGDGVGDHVSRDIGRFRHDPF